MGGEKGEREREREREKGDVRWGGRDEIEKQMVRVGASRDHML